MAPQPGESPQCAQPLPRPVSVLVLLCHLVCLSGPDGPVVPVDLPDPAILETGLERVRVVSAVVQAVLSAATAPAGLDKGMLRLYVPAGRR